MSTLSKYARKFKVAYNSGDMETCDAIAVRVSGNPHMRGGLKPDARWDADKQLTTYEARLWLGQMM
jgi:hypothetical protein